MAVAPSMGFGGLGGDIIVGNFGSGAMVAYNPTTGKLVGPVLDASGFAMRIDGLWALQFGNGGVRWSYHHAVLHRRQLWRKSRDLRHH